ncbi:CinA family protein [Flavobacterium sp.]|uniref:CinA family protein n=1 Tax=Flavobacterium sp. TaxID=239 RepID=UPI0031E317B7
MPSEIVSKCAETLKRKKYNIAFAESMTAGRMAAEFSLTENSGNVLLGSIVCYDVIVKEKIMDIPHALIEKYTPESSEVTKELAEKAAILFCSDFTAAITGLASAGGSETEEKPVGSIFIHLITPMGALAHNEVFSGNPEEIVSQTIDRTAELILAELEKC